MLSGRQVHSALRWRPPGIVLVSALLALALAAAACGGGKQDAPETVAPAATPSATTESTPAAPEPAPQEAATPEPAAAAETQAETAAAAQAEAPAADPNREVLVYGESFDYTLTPEEETRQFRFEGAAGDLVRIYVDGKGGMDPVVTLLEPNRTEIATNDDASATNRDSLLITALASTGLQVVRITAFDAASFGRFVITIENLPRDPDDDSRVIAIGDSVRGVLGDPQDIDVFEFAADKDQHVVVSVDGAAGVDSFAQVFAPDGTFLLANDDGGHGINAELDLPLTQTGAYRVEVTSVGNAIGPYTFSVRFWAEPTLPDEATGGAMAGVAVTYFTALQAGDALTVFALAGPGALRLWGWESAEDVARDMAKIQSIGVAGDLGEVTTILTGDGTTGRAIVPIDAPTSDGDGTIRFDLTLSSGNWTVDFVQRLFEAPAEETPPSGQ